MISLDDLWERDNGICWICKFPCSRSEASRDHIRHSSRGGSNSSRNIRLAHERCNKKRGNSNDGTVPAKVIDEHGAEVYFRMP